MDGAWRSTRDLRLILRLHRAHNPGLYELADQYSHLRPDDLSAPRFQCWTYRRGARIAGFAITEVQGREAAVQELWCEADGLADLRVRRISDLERERLRDAARLLRRVGSPAHGLLVRSASDNPFGALLASRYRMPLATSLILATRRPWAMPPPPLSRGYAVRRFVEGDEGSYAEIHEACFQEATTPDEFLRWASSPQCEAFSATFRGSVVGLFIAEVRRGGSIGDFNLAVHEDHRRRGLATALLSAGLRSFRRRGVRKVVADHWATNAPAVTFYRKHGFRPERVYHFFRARESRQGSTRMVNMLNTGPCGGRSARARTGALGPVRGPGPW